MNSYIRQTPIPADQMHSFLKDKQAWENAIAMYQGPDPLDHWFNYVCWYENHGHGDPENKFRETLERCLTLYEHSDYYKQDARMVRLWLKYIEMQPNPLHFYQVLYQRGVGRQVAIFYINWAGYYESIQALKEAESVYNLGFQEKAQSYAELHHAHSKLMYARTTAAQAAAAAAATAPSHQLKPPQAQSLPQQGAETVYTQTHAQPQPQTQPQQMQPPPHVQNYRQQHVSYQQQPQHAPQHQLQMPVQQPQSPYQQPQHSNYQPQTQQMPQQQPQHLHNVVTEIPPVASYMHPCEGVQIPHAVPAATVPIEQQLPAANAHMLEHYQQAQSQAQPNVVEAAVSSVPGIRMPRKFASFCRNNHETWKPALFLEEPADPSRRCHYAKNLVYPGTGTEYSPEEIRARKFRVHTEEVELQPRTHTETANVDEQFQQLQEIGTVPNNRQLHTQMQSYYGAAEQPLAASNHHAAANNTYQTAEKDNYDENDENDEGGEEEEEEDEEEEEKFVQHTTLQQPSGGQAAVAGTVHTEDDLEDQIEASTIRFSQNKTIKIKFKKERPQGGNSLNGSNYSAYTIESIYQQEIASPTSRQEQLVRRNGHSFHPYSLGQTSTPKTSSKRNKSTSKLKRVNKFQAVTTCSSSNSSSAENVAAPTGPSQNASEGLQNACDNAIHNATFNDNANYSFSSAVALDNSNCSLTSAVGRLNFRDVTAVGGAVANNTSTNAVADFSTYQENSYFATQHDTEAKELRLERALETIDRHLAKEAIDPFSSELCRAFLTKLDFPGADDDHANYKIVQTPLPKIANTRTLSLPEGVYFHIDKEVGRGSYGSVYKATNVNSNDVVALKFQKPPNTWEIYICDQVLKRIRSPNVLPGLMDISTAIIAPNASLIATEFSPFGSLLDINNKIRQATTKVMHESLVMHFSAQICNIIHHLHQQKIIHADIKPDNFLLMRIPSTDLHFPSLRLIDFGCAIDMTLFPDTDNTKFRKVIQTDGFTCIEMQEGRPWSYETDLFCIAGTVHVMLLGEYMQLQKRTGSWDIKQKLPRYLKKHVWTKFFGEMLNVKADALPDLHELRLIFEEEAAKMDSELQTQIRTLSNILYRR